MGASSLKWEGLVLRKTKLKESDLIVSLLKSDGSLLQGVAKGARKPTSTFASRLELFGRAEGMCAQGKGLPIMQEVRLVDAHAPLRNSYESSCCASVLAELLCKIAQPELPVPRLFELSDAAFGAIERASGDRQLLILVAAMLKVFAFMGYRPSFLACASCGTPLVDEKSTDVVMLSYEGGGLLCDSCRDFGSTIALPAQRALWYQALLMSTFDEIQNFEPDDETLTSAFHFCQEWTRTHFGSSLKSIPILLTTFQCE